MKKKSKNHTGFKAVAKKIGKNGAAILASATRRALKSAKRKNPRLKKVR